MQGTDLNLLRVFDALVELRSVTRTAERLGLTQSAVSHALGRLRRELNDPLFLRSVTGLQPSARAQEIAPGIREGLRQLRNALAAPVFDPAQATQSFTIAAGVYFCSLVVPAVFERMRGEAPGIKLHVVPIVDTSASSLDRGTVDLMLAGYTSMPKRFVEESLFVEEMVWIAASGHPLAHAPFDPSALASAPRVMLAAGKMLDLSKAAAINALQEQHFIVGLPGPALTDPPDDACTVYTSQTAIEIVARTDMVALVPRRFADRAIITSRIVVLSPAGTPSFELSMFWHSKRRSDAGLIWLRQLVVSVVDSLVVKET